LPSRSTRSLLTAAILLVALPLLACGDDDTPTAATGTTGADATTSSSASTPVTRDAEGNFHACELVTNAELSDFVGQEITQNNAPTDLDGCTYYSEEGAAQLKSSFALDVLAVTGGAAQFASYYFADDALVDDLGDAAAYEPAGFTTATLYVVKGDTLISMHGQVGLELDGLSADLSLDQLRPIGELAVSRL